MQYSPKLKKAMEEIKEIIKKYDVAASVVLHTPGHGEWYYNINPSYSAVSIDNNHLKLKINCKEHYSGNKELKEKTLSSTANMLHILSVNSGKVAVQLMDMCKVVDEKLNADHYGGGATTHDQQNN